MSERESRWNRFKAELVFRVLWLISTADRRQRPVQSRGLGEAHEDRPDGKGGLILPWHGVTILPIYYCRNMGFHSIVSLSKDGELQNKLLAEPGVSNYSRFQRAAGHKGAAGGRAMSQGRQGDGDHARWTEGADEESAARDRPSGAEGRAARYCPLAWRAGRASGFIRGIRTWSRCRSPRP